MTEKQKGAGSARSDLLNSGQIRDLLQHIKLSYYHCTYFFPIIFDDEKITKQFQPKNCLRHRYCSEKASIDEKQAILYFTPTLRDLLFDGRADAARSQSNRHLSELEPIKEWRLPQTLIDKWRLSLNEPFEDEKSKYPLGAQSVIFESVILYQYFNGIFVLAVRVKPPCMRIEERRKTDSGVNNSFAHGDAENLGSCHRLSRWLRFTRLSRQLYPTFTEQVDENKIAKLHFSEEPISIDAEKFCSCATYEETKSGITALESNLIDPLSDNTSRISAIFSNIFSRFFEEKEREQPIDVFEKNVLLFDDRLFTSTAYVLEESQSEKAINDFIDMPMLYRILAFTHTADRLEDEMDFQAVYPYTKHVVDDMMLNRTLDLWECTKSLSVYTDKVNAHVSASWYSRETIGPKHIPLQYDRMLLVALLYKASLQKYNRWITRVTKGLIEESEKNNLDELKKLREELIQFTNQYWFRNLSEQMQAQMIFKLQTDAMELGTEYNDIVEEIRETDDYLQTRADIKQSEHEARITKLVTIVGLVLSAGVILDVETIFSRTVSGNNWPRVSSVFNWLESFGIGYFHASISAFVVLVLGVLIYVCGPSFLKFWKRKKY